MSRAAVHKHGVLLVESVEVVVTVVAGGKKEEAGATEGVANDLCSDLRSVDDRPVREQ